MGAGLGLGVGVAAGRSRAACPTPPTPTAVAPPPPTPTPAPRPAANPPASSGTPPRSPQAVTVPPVSGDAPTASACGSSRSVRSENGTVGYDASATTADACPRHSPAGMTASRRPSIASPRASHEPSQSVTGRGTEERAIGAAPPRASRQIVDSEAAQPDQAARRHEVAQEAGRRVDVAACRRLRQHDRPGEDPVDAEERPRPLDDEIEGIRRARRPVEARSDRRPDRRGNAGGEVSGAVGEDEEPWVIVVPGRPELEAVVPGPHVVVRIGEDRVGDEVGDIEPRAGNGQDP